VLAHVIVPRLLVYADSTTPTPYLTLLDQTEFGTPRVLLATARSADRIQVLLPVRPNGAEGWVRANDVVLSSDPDLIQIDLTSRTLTWTRDGQVLLHVVVGIGSPVTPTPTGVFFVTDVLREDPNGEYGAWLLALNAHSNVLQVFDGGDPRIALHGTNDPSSVGGAVSNGCIHLDAAPLAALATSIPPGTPVVIR
jgi:hypothetical protein